MPAARFAREYGCMEISPPGSACGPHSVNVSAYKMASGIDMNDIRSMFPTLMGLDLQLLFLMVWNDRVSPGSNA